ncbi:MAG: hypothetical protein ACRD03_00710 [Acidimicrobiales bacterium]
MNSNEQAASKRQVQPAVHIIAAAALALLSISHGIGAVKLLKNGEWIWMGVSFAAMGIYASIAEYLYNAHKKASGLR